MIKTPREKTSFDHIRSSNMLPTVPGIEEEDLSEPESLKMSNRKRSVPKTKKESSDSTVKSTDVQEGDTANPFDELTGDEELERLVVLQMAMQRHQVGGSPGLEDDTGFGRDSDEEESPKRPVSNVISEGFFWRDYPSCEQVLYKHMERYYEVSAIQRNYKFQQSFNNLLVQEVRSSAESAGFSFEESFDDKKLRDRIRCFYKTHLQNAKKRLATLQKHPESLENRCLVAVFIRCVRDRSLTFQDSLAMAPEFPKKRRRMDKVEKLKFDLASSDATFAAKYKIKKERTTATPTTFQQQRFQRAALDAELRAKEASDRAATFKQQEEEERKQSQQELNE